MGRKRLGDSLRERGKVSEQALEKAIQEQVGTAGLLGELLLSRGLISKADLIASLEEVTQTPYVDASSVTVKDKILQLVPGRIARRYCALPVAIEHSKLKVVMEKPQDLHALKELSFASGLSIVPSFGFRNEIMAAVRRYYQDWEAQAAEGQGEQAGAASIEFVTTTSTQRNPDAIREFQAELHKRPTPAVRLVSAVIAEAAAKRASDIHIDPQPQGSIIRIRVDGILRDLMEVPLRLQASLVSRIKILADMDIAERRAPQDGRLLVVLGSEKRDLRVSTLPTHCGEKVVIRLLDSRALVRFQDLGLWEEHADLVGHLLKMPQGMILVTGPTGSGKTTTLYAALNFLRSRNLNIITVEDPVEYRLEGVNQVQVHEKAGRTFPASLRSILRQDPDVIMVGEIRDGETAEIALRAAQTGHWLLSTMHTRDSISAIARLIDLGIPNFLIASTVTAIIAQRLVRRLCECRDEVSASPECTAFMEEAGLAAGSRSKMCIPVGCPVCDKTGYHGRIGLYEILVFDENISESVRSGVSPLEIRRTAQANGLRTLVEDALLKVKMGLTSLEEAMRVIQLKDADGAARRERRAGHPKPGEWLRHS